MRDAEASWLSSYDAAKLNQLSLFVHHFGRDLDAVLLTGDIATSGEDGDIGRAFRFVDSHPVGSSWFSVHATDGEFPTLRRPGLHLLVMPGNHDRYADVPFCYPGGATFDETFRRYWRAGQGVQTQIVLQHEAEQDQLAIISADCSLRSAQDARLPVLGYFAQGRAYNDIVLGLVRQTDEVRHLFERAAIVWALHFPPDPPARTAGGRAKKALHRLIDDRRLLRAARRSQVQHILCGHLHRTLAYSPWGHRRLSVKMVGAACHSVEAASFVVYEVDVHRGTTTDFRMEEYVWDEYGFSQEQAPR